MNINDDAVRARVFTAGLLYRTESKHVILACGTETRRVEKALETKNTTARQSRQRMDKNNDVNYTVQQAICAEKPPLTDTTSRYRTPPNGGQDEKGRPVPLHPESTLNKGHI